MIGTPPSDLPPEIASALASIQQSRFEAFPQPALAYLALAPVWTEQLAEDCRFPASGLEPFLAAAERAKLCIRDPAPDANEYTSEIARTLAALWPFLKEPHRKEFRSTLEGYAARMPDREEGLMLRIGAAAEEGREPDIQWLLSQTAELSDAEACARVLVNAALHAFGSPQVLRLAWDAAGRLSSVDERASARLALCGVFPSLELAGFALETRADIEKIAEPAARIPYLLKLAELWDPSCSAKAADAAMEIQDPGTRAFYCSLIAKRSRPEFAAIALEAAASVTDTAARSRVFSTIALNCGGEACKEALENAWTSALKVQDTAERTALLAAAVSQWAKVQPYEALMRARQLTPPECRAETVIVCLASSPFFVRDGYMIDDESVGRTLDEVEDSIREIPLESARMRFYLRMGALALPYAERALDLAEKLDDEAERRAAILPLLSKLNPNMRGHIVSEILEQVSRIADPQTFRGTLLQLAPCLDESQAWAALTLVVSRRPDRGFRVSESARAEIIDFLRRGTGFVFLYTTAYEIGLAVRNVKKIGIPAPMARWARLAVLLKDINAGLIQRLGEKTGILETPPASGAGPFLTKQVREFVDAGDTGSALAWLEAGQLLMPVAGGDVEAAVLTGRHRVELSYRRAADERHLRRYMPRDEQTAAFEELLDGPDSHWALHYLGVGGVGKTMLLRHITARLAVRQGQRLATSRVDFDHISPEFPVRKPGQLLAELAAELRIYGGSSRIEGKFAEFQDRLLALHSELSRQPPPNDPLINVKSAAFGEVIASFADLVRLLPPPVILILDTCEELSKLEPVNSTMTGIEATFLILQKLHELIPSVRVLMAGRRLLAQSGDSAPDRPARWSAQEAAPGERNEFLPQHKDYLRLHVIRGFTGEECGRFLDVIADVKLTGKQREAILDRSREAIKPIDIVWTPPGPADAEPRWNPFDLALYAEWLREAPEVLPETIRSGKTEPYVEMRIVRRIEKERCRKALPLAVLLRRFDSEMLRPIEPDAAERALIFRDLQGQEWTDSQRDEDTSQSLLEIHPNLRKRIETYFRSAPHDLELEAARGLLAPYLEAEVRTKLAGSQRWNVLNFTRVDPALRLLPGDAAAVLWDEIDRRITASGEWNWAVRVCPQLLGEENAAGDWNAPVRAAVRATLNAALLHLQTDFQPGPAWQEVAERCRQHPVPEIREWLRFRAETFLARNWDEWRALAIRLKSVAWDEERRRQAEAGLFARVYESGTRIDRRTGDWPVFDEDDGPELAPLSYLAFRDAPLYTVDLAQPVQRWADWRIPDCLTDRVRLEMVVTLPRDSWFPFALEWAQTAAGRLDNIDSERLLSALLAGSVLHDAPVELMVQITGAKYFDPGRVPNCPVHNATKPLYYVLALEWKRRGEFERAAEILGTVRQIMLETRQRSPELDELGTLLTTREAASPAAAPAEKFGWANTLGALLGLAMLGGIVYGLYRATTWTVASEQRIATALVILVCAALVRLLRNRVIRVFAALWRPKLIVSDTGDRIQIGYRPGGPWNPSEAVGRDVFEVNRPGPEVYRAQAAGLRDVCSRLKSLSNFFLGGRLAFELKVPLALQGMPWEAFLNLGIGRNLANPREYVQFARTAAPVETGSAHRTSERSVALIARSAQMTLLEHAWAGTEQLFPFTERGLTTAREQATAGRVIHLVGRTRRSGSERTFQITADQYFTAGEITAHGPALVIVQSEPVESLVRTDTDREECAALRAFAAQLFDGGVGTVILLPQMPAATAETVVRKVAAFCRRKPRPGYFAWLNHVSDLRNSIAKSITARSLNLTEAAQQYAHSESPAAGTSARVDVATVNTAREEMSMDVTLWTRIS